MNNNTRGKECIKFSYERYYDNQFQARFSYEYEYNLFGKIEHIYRIYNGERILVKSIYYDGIYRTIPRPYLIDLETFSGKEIVIYYNDKIKYYIQTCSPDFDRSMSEIFEEEDAAQFLLTIKYDNNGNEKLQTLIREKSEYFDESIQIYKIENGGFDRNNNWVRQNVYYEQNNSPSRLIYSYTRFINYE